jgi:hypothetical protein
LVYTQENRITEGNKYQDAGIIGYHFRQLVSFPSVLEK